MKSNHIPSAEILNSIARRAQYLATQMIYTANTRKDKKKGDPKIGGHVSASASALHILGGLHLVVKSGYDYFANKPHASPADHSYNFLLNLLVDESGTPLTKEIAEQTMHNLRKFSHDGEKVFQSYHSAYDPDHHGFLPSGTVGIPPVNVGYLALAYRYAKEHGYKVPEGVHFWALIGDSEFREGSLHEAIPEFAEREIGNLTWIIDYNRQSLDGHRITNSSIMDGSDSTRIERSMRANGWDVIQLRHGSKRLALFKQKGGEVLQKFLESELEDYEFQALLLIREPRLLKEKLLSEHPHLKSLLGKMNEQEIWEVLRDLGGHDITCVIDALEQSKRDPRKPCLIIAHTIKGWNLEMAAMQANHSSISNEEELKKLRQATGLPEEVLFAGFDEKSPEGKYLQQRGELLRSHMKKQFALKLENEKFFQTQMKNNGSIPDSLDINLKMASYPHTQWMLGQLTAKITRIANTSINEKDLESGTKALTVEEKSWKIPAELVLSMAPDVGTSTNLNPAMDGKIFGANATEEFEEDFGVRDKNTPHLVPGVEKNDRFLRFEIVEGNTMSALGSFGKIKAMLGIPLLPLMTVYDFFVKRAHDQFFYNLYWGSEFILAGTPSGVTLSPEGAQHGWKSDFQIPNQITWEPFFCQELDWIFCDAFQRHYASNNKGRSGVFLRLVTRGVEQKDFLKYLRMQKRFKTEQNQKMYRDEMPSSGAVNESTIAPLSDEQIFAEIRPQVLAGGYTLIDYRGYEGYDPGDNVVHIFAMGALGAEAIEASETLLKRGIFANVIIVTSPDLLLGNFAHDSNYDYLKNHLHINSDLFLQAESTLSSFEAIMMSGRRVPIVSVHDGEPGLLDNIGSVIGVKHIALAVRKHSKCGRPDEVYAYHHIDAASVVEACGQVLSETALEGVRVSPDTLAQLQAGTNGSSSDAGATAKADWRSLWPH